jgi:uncharacterized protein YndB with AHSA1/START domain
MWAFEHSVDTTASPATVWRLYVDVAGWPSWNGAVQSVELDGPFQAGTSGWLTPPGADPLRFHILDATEDGGYTSETTIAETVRLRATNTLTPLPGGGCRIVHRAELVGPAAEYFGQSFGPALRDGVPRTAEALAARAAAVAGEVAA